MSASALAKEREDQKQVESSQAHQSAPKEQVRETSAQITQHPSEGSQQLESKPPQSISSGSTGLMTRAGQHPLQTNWKFWYV
jgi:hypothetical protein